MEIVDIAGEMLAQKGYSSIKIKNKVYCVKLLPASKGAVVATNIIKTFLPALAAWADGERRKDFVMPEEDMMFSEVAIMLVKQMDNIDLTKLIQILLLETLVDNKQIDFDKEFAGNYSTLVKLTEFALKENFSDFFTEYLLEKGISVGSLKILSQKEKQAQTQAEFSA